MTRICTGALASHGSAPGGGSASSAAISASSGGSSTTSKRCPWLKPPLGARRTVDTIRSTVSRGTGSRSKWRTIRRRLSSSRNSTSVCNQVAEARGAAAWLQPGRSRCDDCNHDESWLQDNGALRDEAEILRHHRRRRLEERPRAVGVDRRRAVAREEG